MRAITVVQAAPGVWLEPTQTWLYTQVISLPSDIVSHVACTLFRHPVMHARLFAQVDARLASSGDLESRNTSLKRDLDQIADDKEALALRMEQVEARYRKQFTALDSLLAQLQTTSSYLAQQLASVPKAGS